MRRKLEDLILLASTLAHVSDEELRDNCIQIARTKSPTSAYDYTLKATSLYSLDPMEQTALARATRWLAVIRRDYGKESFEEAVRTLTSQARA